jgi:MFS family permease
MLILKLALVAATVLLSSLASRRFGHAVGGTIAGMPMIAGPIIGFVLWQETPQQTRAIALATLVCLPAAMVHMVTFAWAATRWRWPWALLAANAAFFASGALLSLLHLPVALLMPLAIAAPALGVISVPRLALKPMAVAIPNIELACRVIVALAMAWALMRGAGVLPAAMSGLLLAMPIAGNVLPCFTLPRYGAAATVALVSGFMRGVYGFVVFFIALYAALAWLSPALSYALAWLAAAGAALAVALHAQRLRRQSARLPETA